MHALYWMIDGIVVGWLSQLVPGSRRNRVVNLVMGAAGGVAGGFLLIVSPFFVYSGMAYSDLGAILGAVALTFLSRYVGASRDYDATIVQRTFRMNRSRFPRVHGLVPQPVAYARSRREVL
jgi:uncharacterized membrane protein YeaQ/YmgE (transglycosylase-associated protein family)